ncbi:MAG: hypothetical protein ABSA78_01045 [Candidatus Sulfotelmatobacter sp.]|jgi:hypothetical protein
MRRHEAGFGRAFSRALAAGVAVCLFLCVKNGSAQGNGFERSFPQSKATVEEALKEMQGATAGRLPVLDGFATAADHPLDRYRRGYYQAKFEVSAGPTGGSIVRVSVDVTAWYVDPAATRSGYELLRSNGRLEADLLDQLADQLAAKGTQAVMKPKAVPAPAPAPVLTSSSAPPPSSSGPPPASSASGHRASAPSNSGQPVQTADSAQPTISAPVPRIPETGSGLSPSMAQGLAEEEKNGVAKGANGLAEKNENGLRAEADSLEEVLKNQAHPKNLVAVKKSGTPVVATASLTAKTLFLASAHDEFEMLDFNRDWVHVRISGLSRGWIWRDSLEMPDSVPDSDLPAGAAGPVPVATDLFHVTREETATFPGDWEPLRGKSVRIVSVEKISESEKDAGARVRLEFAKSVLDQDYAQLAQKPQELAGIVLIFDSVDGGMIAATLATLQQWKAGKLSDAALWHQCYFDPPETFTASGSAASQ